MGAITNPYELYESFLKKSTSLNRILYSIRHQWDELHIPATYDDAGRFSHLIMFLSQVMAFEAFVARCLCDECGLTPRQVKRMGNMEVKIRSLLPGIDHDANLRAYVRDMSEAIELRHTWMHGCGDPALTVRGAGKETPKDIFDESPWDDLKWVDGHVWSKAARSLPDIARRIAERFGWTGHSCAGPEAASRDSTGP